MGLTHFATLSDGIIVGNPRHLKKREEKLAFLNRQLSKKKKGSKNRLKARHCLSVAFEKVVNARDDFLQKTSTMMVHSYSLIGLEKLKVQKMSEKCFGKSIFDASWSKWVRLLAYKAEEAGCQIILVDPRNTTTQCGGGGVMVEKTLFHRRHQCAECGLIMDRDLNAAINILAKATAGMAGSNACGVEESSSSLKQEAQEVFPG